MSERISPSDVNYGRMTEEDAKVDAKATKDLAEEESHSGKPTSIDYDSAEEQVDKNSNKELLKELGEDRAILVAAKVDEYSATVIEDEAERLVEDLKNAGESSDKKEALRNFRVRMNEKIDELVKNDEKIREEFEGEEDLLDRTLVDIVRMALAKQEKIIRDK